MAKNWIQGAIKKPGALRKQLGVKQGDKIPKAKLDKAAKAPGKLGQRARLAKTLGDFKGPKKMNKGGTASNDDLVSKIFKRASKEERRMIKALIDAGEALPDWLLQSEGDPPDDIYATKGTSKRYPEGWAEEFMSDKEKKEYRTKKAKNKKPVKKAKGGMVTKWESKWG